MEKLGYDRYGTEHCYDGRTGEPIDRELFITPTYYQRLQKFVIDEVYSISTGPTCIITRRNNRLPQSVSNYWLVMILINDCRYHSETSKLRENPYNFEYTVLFVKIKRIRINHPRYSNKFKDWTIRYNPSSI